MMKNKKQNLSKIILAVFILIGIGITFSLGLNWNINYKKTEYLQFEIGKDFEIEDINNILKQVLKTKFSVQKVEIFETTVLIKAESIDDEQIDSILNKINEKYELELNKDLISIGKIPNSRGRDIIKPYLIPTGISIGIILAILAVYYRKIITLKLLFDILAETIITLLLLLSIYAIFRIQVNSITMPIAIISIICYFIISINKLNEKKYNK